jgi:hypothetical protein
MAVLGAFQLGQDARSSSVQASAALQCGDGAERGVVALGQKLYDRAKLSGGTSPTGTVTFALYGPDDDCCTDGAIFVSEVPVNGNGWYMSAPYTTERPGVYRWVASYSGDWQNEAVTTGCNETRESVRTRATPRLVTLTSVASV